MKRGQGSDQITKTGGNIWSTADRSLPKPDQPMAIMGIFRRDNSPAFCIFVNFRVLSDVILLRDLNPILNHFSDVFSPTPKTEVKSWNKGKDMSLVSKTVIMTQSDTFQGQAIKKKHKQISDLVSPEYDKQGVMVIFQRRFCFRTYGITKWSRSQEAASGTAQEFCITNKDCLHCQCMTTGIHSHTSSANGLLHTHAYSPSQFNEGCTCRLHKFPSITHLLSGRAQTQLSLSVL